MTPQRDHLHDVLVIGAGPTGLACAIDAQNEGLDVVLVDKGCLTNSLFHYPANMTFFTTPELLEIGNMPFSSPNQKPTRAEALEYYRKVAQHYQLDVRQYERVDKVSGSDGDFHVHTVDRFDREHVHRARKIIVSTGYYDLPNHLGIPGEDLRKVAHYYDEPHPYFAQDVLVIGGKNSAAIAALDLWRHGARVTLVHRGPALHRHIKYWIKPDIENRIKNGEIAAYFNTTVTNITEDAVTLATPARREDVAEPVCLRADRLSPRLRLHRIARREARPGQRALPHLQARNAGVQCAWALRRRRCRCWRAHQRDLHRERPLPRRGDRRGPRREARQRPARGAIPPLHTVAAE